MSRFFSSKYDKLIPYTPGEQPKHMKFVKLNTNESPFPPSPAARQRALDAARNLQLYSDPECKALVDLAAKQFGIESDEILFTNGSDEILNFAFMAFCDETHGAVFPDITYGFYSVFANLNGVPYETIPLAPDFSVCVEDYVGLNRTIFLANPNAPTGLALSVSQIETILKGNPNNVVVVDEAYVDFGAESVLPLIHQYSNLLVTQTFSKSRSMAGARLGFGAGCKELIRDLNTIKYSTNPYNVNSMTMAAGIGALEDDGYFRGNCRTVAETRQWTLEQLRSRGFSATDSMANFVFVSHPAVPGGAFYEKLRARGILVRHFNTPRLTDYLRITVGSMDEMMCLMSAVDEILKEASSG